MDRVPAPSGAGRVTAIILVPIGGFRATTECGSHARPRAAERAKQTLCLANGAILSGKHEEDADAA